MNTGKETWKWGLVALLLAIFLITANQAYQHIANQEDYAPPDDYLKGDSWDLEHGSGPGAGQPMQMPTDYNRSQTTPTPIGTGNSDSELSGSLTSPEPIILEDNVNWDQNDSGSNQPAKNTDSANKNHKSDTTTQEGMYEIFTTPSVNETTPSSSDEKNKENPTSNNTETKQDSVPEPAKQEVPTEEKSSEAIPAETPTASPAEAQTNNQSQPTAETKTETPTANSTETPNEAPKEVPAQPANEIKNPSEPAADVSAAQ